MRKIGFTPRTWHEDYRGFYVNINPPAKPSYYPEFEDLTLNFYKSGAVTGESNGPTHEDKNIINIGWRISGFISGEYIFMSYITVRVSGKSVETNSDVGVVTYILQKRGGIFAGYIVFRDPPNDVTLKCPYILTQEMQMDPEAAKNRWPPLQEECEKLMFPTRFN